MKNYVVRTGCEIAGRWRDADEIVSLSADQAREISPPFGDVVSQIAAKTSDESSDHAKLHRNKRRDRRASERLGAHATVNPQNIDDAYRGEGDAPYLRKQDPGSH